MSNIKDTSPTTPTISNKVLEVFDIAVKHDFIHIREISRLVNIAPTTAGNILKELEENNILSKKVLGKNCFYSLNKNHKSRKLIAMAENYKFLKECRDERFSAMSEKLMDNIASIKSFIDSIIAYKENEKLSLLFITSLDHETIKSRIMAAGITAERITVLTRENFKNNLENEMIKNILKDHIMISGAENFVDLAY